MATAFGVREPGTALVVIFDSADFLDKRRRGLLSDHCRNAEWTTKAVPSSRTPKAPPFQLAGSFRLLFA